MSEEKSFMVMASSAVEKDGWLQAIRACMRDLSLNAEAWEKMRGGQVSSARVAVIHCRFVGESWLVVWDAAHFDASSVLSDPRIRVYLFVEVCSCAVLWAYVKCMVESSYGTRSTFRIPHHSFGIATSLELSCRYNPSSPTFRDANNEVALSAVHCTTARFLHVESHHTIVIWNDTITARPYC